MTLQLENYRSSKENREILRILQKSSSLQENFIWQATPMGKNIVSIHHFEIDFVAREVVVFFNDKNHRIEGELPLYVKLDYRTSVFKVSEYRQGAGTLHFSFPKEIKTQELRSNPRHAFSPGDGKYVVLKPSIKGQVDGSELVVRTMDVSYFGLGLIVTEHNRSFLKNNRILWVTRLQDEDLIHPILAEVVYITSEVDASFLNRKVKELKVGLKLSGVFPEDALRRFKL